MSIIPDGYFKKNHGPLKGRDWLKRIPKEDRQAFSRIGFMASDYGSKGGLVRATHAERDSRGRFVKSGGGK